MDDSRGLQFWCNYVRVVFIKQEKKIVITDRPYMEWSSSDDKKELSK